MVFAVFGVGLIAAQLDGTEPIDQLDVGDCFDAGDAAGLAVQVDDPPVRGRHHGALVTGDLPVGVAKEEGCEEPQGEGEGRGGGQPGASPSDHDHVPGLTLHGRLSPPAATIGTPLERGAAILASRRRRTQRFRSTLRAGTSPGAESRPVGSEEAQKFYAQAALDAGVPLRDVQEAASHADPRTTMRYDRARRSLDRHATYIVATFVAGATQ